MKPKQQRCAIYTRKSTEEGLEQGFNSLHAQREACAAYVASQVGEGWQLLPAHYDDGGFSGGSMERPALTALLADIDRGKVDVVVVYKVDRLTRSLSDFARIVERFDAAGVSFVSVTQAFNTTNSMGRLTLNVLLSFAQFEREVTGERIRDKIAASKAKGMWMGGNPPLGYTPDGRTLVIEPNESETVRFIFRRYLELGSVHQLQAELADKGIRAKRWVTRKGTLAGGGVLARGALYHLLRNRHYRGEIVHKGVAHPGQHEAIVDAKLFDAVQAKLQSAAQRKRNRSTSPDGALLTGLLYDDAGNRMCPTHARGKSGAAHRYYVSKALITGQKHKAGSIGRIPAKPLEELVLDRLTRLNQGASITRECARAQIKRITIRTTSMEISLAGEHDAAALTERLPHTDTCELIDDVCVIIVPAQLGRRAGSVRLLDPSGRRITDAAQPDSTLIEALAKGWQWREQLLSGRYTSSTALADEVGQTQTSLHRFIRLAYLAPDLIREILDGRHKPGLTLDQLCRPDLPLNWDAQRRLLSAR